MIVGTALCIITVPLIALLGFDTVNKGFRALDLYEFWTQELSLRLVEALELLLLFIFIILRN